MDPSSMESSDEGGEDFNEACDSFLDVCRGEEEDESLTRENEVETLTHQDSYEQLNPSDQTETPLEEGKITVENAGCEAVSLVWTRPEGSAGCAYVLTYSCSTQSDDIPIPDSNAIEIENLLPGTEYDFTVSRVAANGPKVTAATMSTCTKPVPPENIYVYDVGSDSVSLSWDSSAGGVGEYIVTCAWEGKEVQNMTTDSNSLTFTGLKPGVTYSFKLSNLLKNGNQSKSLITFSRTKTMLESLLHDLGLEHHYTEKLTLSDVLQIDLKTTAVDQAQCLSDVPWAFLKRLMLVNVNARSVKNTFVDEAPCDSSLSNVEFDLDSLVNSQAPGDFVNPLDIVTALFLCSNGFLQQEMILKMSMCQFSVPFLLPNCDQNQCTLMLWAMRDIVKKFRPHSLVDPKGFVENRIVTAEIPMVSFVRLGECSLSKSQILNKILSNPQQYHDTFVHKDMECGDLPRRISNGLVEISWYVPCGKKNIDIFGEPVAVANLRGDIASFETQYAFLCQTSRAVFVFFDNLDSNYKILTSLQTKAQLFLVGNSQSQNFRLEALKKTITELNLKKSNIILKTRQMNDADFVKNLRHTVSNIIGILKSNMSVEKMSYVAHELGIFIDESSQECQRAKQNADAITMNIKDTQQYKEGQLPLQGHIWKELTWLEKEQCRLRRVGDSNIEWYKDELQKQKAQLRVQQNQYDISEAMACFIKAISCSGTERSYFLKWMKMNLDNLSRESLSDLREQYKEKCQNSPENKEEIKKLDIQLSSSSLGIEHFLRELGQIYESSVLLEDAAPSRQQLLHLPKLCAELLLDGFPLELVDGDASNIPLRWVSDVLCHLNAIVQPKSKILVVTVLGVQSTGKSTLLNTMFGVQFAVSSGRCTRGAFMLLIEVNDNIKGQLNCDFLVIIDTEGLKSPELAQLDESFEHDNELATLVVGLSDVTIINIAMENSVEMKDILQIVVHAFLRMKEVGKKPRCLFVHQNVSDVSAHDKNMRDRKLLLEQLNEMTCAAAKMENKEENKNFTDVMEYNPDTGNWYIPGLWHGNPPMAPVNAGYSESVYELKKNMIQVLGSCDSSANNILDFLEWTKSLWNAVKYENFIFSFRNSLVADAYMKLCIEFNKWDWSFRKHMYTWITNAETRISNFALMAEKSNNGNVRDFLCQIKSEASMETCKWENKTIDNLKKYYEQTDGHVYLVERYREDFASSIKGIKREMDNAVLTKLEAAVEIQEGMSVLDSIKKDHTDTIERNVLKLLEDCKKNKSQRTEEDLAQDFEKVWRKAVQQLPSFKLLKQDIVSVVYNHLRGNLKHKSGSVNEKLNKAKLEEYANKPFKVSPENYFMKIINNIYVDERTRNAQTMADNLIERCREIVNEKVAKNTDYYDTYTGDILHVIDETLERNKSLETSERFEVSIKLRICGYAATKFQIMHEKFIENNDPRRRLEQFKQTFFSDFKDLFNEIDQCQKKAREFADLCLRPAVKAFVNDSLGQEIVDEMLTGQNAFQFSTRSFFQYSILKQLLSEFTFKTYRDYICSYEGFVKNWIFGKIVNKFSHDNKMVELEKSQLKGILKIITDTIKKTQTPNTNGIKGFIRDICRELGGTLVIPQDALDATMILNNADQEEFAHCLVQCVEEMMQTITDENTMKSLDQKLRGLKVQPQNELFSRVFGCGKQCPFCKAPCEAGGETHTAHFASIHRPQGLGSYSFVHSRKLTIDLCSSSVHSEEEFKCCETNNEYHPFKRYREVFPDWHIPADASIEASDYWKYVMAQFNKEFAKEYHASAADIPLTWSIITKEQAEKSLMESFGLS